MRQIGTLVLFILAFIMFYASMIFFASSAYNNLEIIGKFDKPGTIKLYYANQLHGFSEGKFIEHSYPADDFQQSIVLQLNNKSLNQFKLQFSTDSSELAIKKLAFHGFFQKQQLSWNAKQIEQEFLSNTPLLLSDENQLTLTPKNGLVSLNSKLLTANGNFIITWILPFALALALILLVTNTNWSNIPVFTDLLSNQQNRNQHNFSALDGLRGIAALLVLLEHTIPEFLGAGRAGVWLFFVLSGFLLSKPFVLNPQIVLNIKSLSTYMQRRVKRILPMFYFTITIIFLLRGHIDKAMRHYLFVQGDGHFWTILHEIYFYILLPFIALACYLLCRGKHIASITFLVVLSLLWSHYGNANIISIYGLNSHQVPNFDIFLLGMIGGYLYFGLFQQSNLLQKIANKLNIALSCGGLICLFALTIFSAQLGMIKESFEVWLYPYFSGVVCLLLVLFSTIGSTQSFYNRFLSLSALRLIGIIGYSFYLLHPYAIGVTKTVISHLLAIPVNGIPVIFTVIGSIILTTLFASFTYSYIERPFLQKVKSKS